METSPRKGAPLRHRTTKLGDECPAPASYEAALTRAEQRLKGWEAVYERERAEALGLVAELLGRPPERQELILRNNSRYFTWGVLERLLDVSWTQRFESSERAEHLAHLALLVTDRLDASFYSFESLEDLRARAWGYIGNARRIRADLGGATRAFAAAFNHLRHGTREPIEYAALLDLQASLRRAQRRFLDALRLLWRAFDLFEAVGDRHRAGRTLLGIETVLNYAGQPEKGIPILYKAIELIDSSQEPKVLLCAWHNLIDGLVDAGRHLEARRLLSRVQPLYVRFPDVARSRNEWVAGKIALGLHRDGEAEALLLRARAGFLAEDAPYEVAMISLQLSILYSRQGRTLELKELAAEMVPFFSSRQIHREAAAALAYWKHAVDTETAGLDLATRLVAFLKRARYDLDLPFEPPT